MGVILLVQCRLLLSSTLRASLVVVVLHPTMLALVVSTRYLIVRPARIHCSSSTTTAVQHLPPDTSRLRRKRSASTATRDEAPMALRPHSRTTTRNKHRNTSRPTQLPTCMAVVAMVLLLHHHHSSSSSSSGRGTRPDSNHRDRQAEATTNTRHTYSQHSPPFTVASNSICHQDLFPFSPFSVSPSLTTHIGLSLALYTSPQVTQTQAHIYTFPSILCCIKYYSCLYSIQSQQSSRGDLSFASSQFFQ